MLSCVDTKFSPALESENEDDDIDSALMVSPASLDSSGDSKPDITLALKLDSSVPKEEKGDTLIEPTAPWDREKLVSEELCLKPPGLMLDRELPETLPLELPLSLLSSPEAVREDSSLKLVSTSSIWGLKETLVDVPWRASRLSKTTAHISL